MHTHTHTHTHTSKKELRFYNNDTYISLKYLVLLLVFVVRYGHVHINYFVFMQIQFGRSCFAVHRLRSTRYCSRMAAIATEVCLALVVVDSLQCEHLCCSSGVWQLIRPAPCSCAAKPRSPLLIAWTRWLSFAPASIASSLTLR